MKPSVLLKKKIKGTHRQLDASLRLIDAFLGTQEVEWVIECMKKEKKALKRGYVASSGLES